MNESVSKSRTEKRTVKLEKAAQNKKSPEEHQLVIDRYVTAMKVRGFSRAIEKLILVMSNGDFYGSERIESFMMMTYSAELRVGEIVRLQAEDIDNLRMWGFVRHERGGKRQIFYLPAAALDMMTRYYRTCRQQNGCLVRRSRGHTSLKVQNKRYLSRL